jgi:hypothetical protein
MSLSVRREQNNHEFVTSLKARVPEREALVVFDSSSSCDI